MKFNMSVGTRLTVLVCAFIFGLFITAMAQTVASKLFGIGGNSLIWLSSFIQDVLVFIFPAVLVGALGKTFVTKALRLNIAPTIKQLVFVVLVYVVSLPAMNWLVEWNASMTLPASLSGLEQALRAAEEAAQHLTDSVLNSTSFSSFLCSLFVVAIMAGLSEELFFRGALLGLWLERGVKVHVSVWIVAVIFSFIHFQFFGFVPRLLLGAWLGYLMVWSRSLWVPIAAHIFNNAMVVVFKYLTNLHVINGDAIDRFGTAADGAFPVIALISAAVTALVIIYGRKYVMPSD